MPMIVTTLEARVASSAQAALRKAYADAADESLPPGLVSSTLMLDANDATRWIIETLWESPEALNAMRKTESTPRGVSIFRAAGAEPTLNMFIVERTLSPV